MVRKGSDVVEEIHVSSGEVLPEQMVESSRR